MTVRIRLVSMAALTRAWLRYPVARLLGLRARRSRRDRCGPAVAAFVGACGFGLLASASPAQAQATTYFRSGATAQTGSGATSITINQPANLTAGDVMIAAIDAETNSSITAPSGWSAIGLYDGVNCFNYAALGHSGVYFKVAGSSEPASYTWGLGTARKATGKIADYVGVDTGSPIEAENNGPGSCGTSTTLGAPSVTTTVANSMVVVGAAADYSSSLTISPPSGTTDRTPGGVYTSGSGNVIGSDVADFVQGATGATGTKNFSSSQSAYWGAITIALKPAASGTLQFAVAPVSPALGSFALNGTAQTTNATMNNFAVDDTSGSGSGWNLTVQGDSGGSAVFKQYCPNSTCGTDSGPGYIGGGFTLPAGSLKLNTTGASMTTTGGAGVAPAFQCSGGCSVDASSPTKIVSASQSPVGGQGPWSTTGFTGTSLQLTTPTTVRVLAKPGELYRVDLVWTINSGP